MRLDPPRPTATMLSGLIWPLAPRPNEHGVPLDECALGDRAREARGTFRC
jgi:hypothetical protein